MIETFFPSLINFFAKLYRGGTPTPPPINKGLDPDFDVSYPFPKPTKIFKTFPFSYVDIREVPSPTTL